MNNDAFIKNIINNYQENTQIINNINDTNQEIKNIVEQIYKINIVFDRNINNKKETLDKLLNEYYLYKDIVVIGSYIRYIENDDKLHTDLKLKMGGFVLKDSNDKLIIRNKIGRIFSINKNKYSIFIKLNNNDKFRIMIDKI